MWSYFGSETFVLTEKYGVRLPYTWCAGLELEPRHERKISRKIRTKKGSHLRNIRFRLPVVDNKGLSSCSSQGKSFCFVFCLARSGGRYAFGYADLRFATVQSLKSAKVNCRFLNALGSRPLSGKRKNVGKIRHF